MAAAHNAAKAGWLRFSFSPPKFKLIRFTGDLKKTGLIMSELFQLLSQANSFYTGNKKYARHFGHFAGFFWKNTGISRQKET
jgi:hypothetical protein